MGRVKKIVYVWMTSVLVLVGAQDAPCQNYIVQYGDTLWDISGNQLNNPYRWRDIHQNNPHIVNPNLIYPGDILSLTPGSSGLVGGLAGERSPASQAGKKPLSDKAIARPWYGRPVPESEEVAPPEYPTPLVPTTDFIEVAGYIVPYRMKDLESENFAQITGAQLGEREENTQIIRSEYGQPGLAYGDIIYLNRGLRDHFREGDTFLGFRPIREIKHPLTSEILGTQIAILGHLRIRSLEDGISCAQIFKSYNYMEVGTPVMPVSELVSPIRKPLKGNSRSYGFKVGNQLVGHIVSGREPRQGFSRGDILFLDIGAAQGVQPADNLVVFRDIGKGYPKQSIGRVTVLSTQKHTSTAMIIESRKLIEVGEKVVLIR